MAKKRMTAAMDKQFDKTEAAFPDSKFPPKKKAAKKKARGKKKAG